VFDGGIRLWADALARCASEYARRFRPFARTGKPKDQQNFAEEQARMGLADFLGVDLSIKPSQWPEPNKVQTFIFEACPTGPILPVWFDVGLTQISVLSTHPPTRLSKDGSAQQIRTVFEAFANHVISELRDAYADDRIELGSPKPKNIKPLPAKNHDLSEMFDHANLRPRQREIAELAWERDMSVKAIAEHLGRHRTTVDESLKSAKKRIDASRQYDRVGKRLAVHLSADDRTGPKREKSRRRRRFQSDRD
jgi:DNA-binding CsgD family transcriptional regulator